jgi:hypothetical protein
MPRSGPVEVPHDSRVSRNLGFELSVALLRNLPGTLDTRTDATDLGRTFILAQARLYGGGQHWKAEVGGSRGLKKWELAGPARSQDPNLGGPNLLKVGGWSLRRFQETRCWKEGGISTQISGARRTGLGADGLGEPFDSEPYACALWEIIVLISVTQAGLIMGRALSISRQKSNVTAFNFVNLSKGS